MKEEMNKKNTPEKSIKNENKNQINNISKANIEMRKENKNKKRKNIKIRAYCNKCYQFFENGPYSKICRNHLKKSCNLIECQKYKQNGDNTCIRKFTNINSANRHTHCLTKKEVEIWDPNCEIQKCLGKKIEHDNKFMDILNNDKNFNLNKNNNNNNKSFFSENSLNMNLNNMNNIFLNSNNNYFFDINNNSNSNNNVMELIEDIDKLHFTENDNLFNNDNNNNVSDKNIDKNNNNDINIKLEKMNINEEKKEITNNNFDNESIDSFFERVQKETNIPNNIKKKLVNAFKKKGILNVKILMLFYEKYKSWDFLLQKFKNVTSQIEGVALCIEFLLKK
jgi:hypothetical protein